MGESLGSRFQERGWPPAKRAAVTFEMNMVRDRVAYSGVLPEDEIHRYVSMAWDLKAEIGQLKMQSAEHLSVINDLEVAVSDITEQAETLLRQRDEALLEVRELRSVLEQISGAGQVNMRRRRLSA